MSYQKFNIGDEVVRINENNGGTGAKVGQRARIVGFDKDGDVFVVYPGCLNEGVGGSELWYARNTKLIRRAAKASKPQDDLKWTEVTGERARTYLFPNAENLRIERVVRICVRPTNHRLETACGRKVIVPGKFLAIEIEADGWSA
jgi:hypothetical protein